MVIEDPSTFDLKIITKNFNNAYIILISFKIDINNILSHLLLIHPPRTLRIMKRFSRFIADYNY